MKAAIGREIESQRGLEVERADKTPTRRPAPAGATLRQQRHATLRWRKPRSRALFGRTRPVSTPIRGSQIFGTALLRLRAVARNYQRQMERELAEDVARRGIEGWTR
jgi:hypothetical protein